MEGKDRYPVPPPGEVGGGTWDPALLLLPELFPVQATKIFIKASPEEGPLGGRAHRESLPPGPGPLSGT